MSRLQRIAMVCLAAVGALLAGCGGAVSTTPVAVSGSAATPSATSTYALPIVSVTTQPVAGEGTPIPLPALSSDFASLASVLVAAQPVAAANAGVLGTITAITGRTITLLQTTPLAATDSTGATPDFEAAYASVGTPGGTVTMTVAQNATVATPDGFADLAVGQQIIAGGTASGSTLAARFVMIVADVSTTTAALAKRFAAAAPAAPTPVPTPPPGWVSTNGTLKNPGNALSGAIHLNGSQIVLSSAKYACSLGAPATASATLQITADAALSLSYETAVFPYRIDYNPTPAPYISTTTGYQSPGAMNTWLQFVPLPGSSAAPTYDIGDRMDASFDLVTVEPCTNGKFTILGVTAGYGYEASTTAAFPSGTQTVTLQAVKCVDVNVPIHFSFPAGGLGGASPLGDSEAGLDVCTIPQIQGGAVSATPANVMQGSFSGGQVVFDPSQSGPASVSTAPLLNPTGPNASFGLNPTAPLTQIDGQQLQYTLFGVCVLGYPSCASNTGAPLFLPFTVQLSSTPQTINLSAPQFATCVVSNPILTANGSPPSTDCNAAMYIAIGDDPSTITISNLPQGTYSFSAAGQGALQQYGPPCTGANFTPYFTVTPASATGTSVTFSFEATGNTQNAQLQCAGTYVNQNGVAVQFAQNQTISANLLINEFPFNPNSKARRSK